LETTQKSFSMSWENKKEVKKGNIGELIVQKSLELKGYIVYKPITEKAHAFDFLAIKGKRVFVIAEIKSKARLNKYFATGIDTRHFEEYKFILEKQKIDVIIFFVDEHPQEERVYCQKLSELIKPKIVDGVKYPNFEISKNKVLFSLNDMITVRKLNKNEIEELKKYSSRNYDYH